MTIAIQHSFSSGEIAPSLYSRTDHTKYATGLKTCRNFIISKSGGAKNRPGTTFVQEVSNSSAGKVRLIPFIASQSLAYGLEFGNQYIRFFQNGQQVLNPTQVITGITQANPAVVTCAGHGYTNGQEVNITKVSGMGQINVRNFKIAGVTTNTFQLQNMDGSNVNSTGYGAYVSGGLVASVYQISSPYLTADLPLLNFDEDNYVMTLTHPSYPIYKLTYTGPTNWVLSPYVFNPNYPTPYSEATAGASGSHTYIYQTTEFYSDGTESTPHVVILGGTSLAKYSVSSITNSIQPLVTTAIPHGLSPGMDIFFISMGGMPEINGVTLKVGTTPTSTTFTIANIDSTNFGVYSSGGSVLMTDNILSCAPPTLSNPNAVTVVNLPVTVKPNGAYLIFCNVYLSIDGGDFGFIGTTESVGGLALTLNDIGITPNTAIAPPQYKNNLNSKNNYPGNSTYYQQRHVFANTNNDPQGVLASEIGYYGNFTPSEISVDSDPVIFDVAGSQVNPIQHMLDMGSLILFTANGEYACNVGTGAALTPTSINAVWQSGNGSSYLRPVVVNGSAIYVQARGTTIRDLLFDFVSDSYHGNDLTVFSQHLFDGYSLVDMDYAQIPNSLIYVVRSDGTLLTVTYVREQQIIAWAHHDTNGQFENVICIPEGNEDAVYVVVNRTTAFGEPKRFIERFQTRTILQSNIQNAVFMDSAQVFDGTNYGTGTMTLTGTTYVAGEVETLTSSAAYFNAAMVGNQFTITGADGKYVRVNVVAYSSSTVISVQPVKTVPVSCQNTATTSWVWMVNQVSGLWRLNGQTVSIYGDSTVIGSPNNFNPQNGQPTYPTYTVQNGSLTLPRCYGIISIGLPYLSDLQTLNLDVVGYAIFAGQSMIDKNKLVSRVDCNVELTKGIFVGPFNPDTAIENLNNNPMFMMSEQRSRSQGSTYDSSPKLLTDVLEINIEPQWNSNGSVFFRVCDPVPVTILDAAVGGYLPMRQ